MEEEEGKEENEEKAEVGHCHTGKKKKKQSANRCVSNNEKESYPHLRTTKNSPESRLRYVTSR